MKDKYIKLAHGNGGRAMRELVQDIFKSHLAGLVAAVDLNARDDAAVLPVINQRLVVTTDSFTVTPLEFPGGDIGKLAVCGAVNDLLVCGAVPKYLTLGVILEEGLAIDVLERCVKSLAAEAKKAQVAIVTGDTKVVPRGEGGGIYFNVTALGYVADGLKPGFDQIQAGDKVIVSGPIGEHGAAVLLARQAFGLRSELKSDCACLLEISHKLRHRVGVRFMRDPTRGGVATVCHEITQATGLSVSLDESCIPVRAEVESMCELLGYEALYLTCEGRLLLVADSAAADSILDELKALETARQAAIIGEIIVAQTDAEPDVILKTRLGGERLVQELLDAPLPRIC